MEAISGLVIRKAVAEDAAAIHHVFCESIARISFEFYCEVQKQAWVEAISLESWTTTMLELHLFVAEANDEVAGFVSWYGHEIVHVYSIGPKSTGTQLMTFALDSMGAGEVTLTSSLNAERFYEQFKFVRQELIVKERGGIEIPCVRMRRVFAP